MANIPLGLVQNEELFNLLSALAMSGGADIKTLVMVAQAAGIGPAFITWLQREANAPRLSTETMLLAQLEAIL